LSLFNENQHYIFVFVNNFVVPTIDLLMRYGISRFFHSMNTLQALILRKVIDAIDSDDIELLANQIESDFSGEELLKLQKMLKAQIARSEKNAPGTRHLKQLLTFID
jgi:hypothetical protein